MRTVKITNRNQRRRAMAIMLRFMFKNQFNVSIGPFNSSYFDEFGMMDIIGRNEDKAWEAVTRKLKREGVQIG